MLSFHYLFWNGGYVGLRILPKKGKIGRKGVPYAFYSISAMHLRRHRYFFVEMKNSWKVMLIVSAKLS